MYKQLASPPVATVLPAGDGDFQVTFQQLYRLQLLYFPISSIRDVGTGRHWGHVPPQDFAINKEVPFSFLENAFFFLRKKVPSKCRAP